MNMWDQMLVNIYVYLLYLYIAACIRNMETRKLKKDRSFANLPYVICKQLSEKGKVSL